MDRMERRDVLLAGVAASAGLLFGRAEGAEGTPGWIAGYDPKELADLAIEELDYVLKNSRWVPPRKVTDTTVVPRFLDTSKMKRNFEKGTFEDNQVVEVAGSKYKLDWIMSNFELSGRVELDQIRSEYLLPSFNFWRKQFADQLGEGALIVTRMPTRDVQSRRSVTDVRSFTLVKYDLALRVTVAASLRKERAFLVFDSLVGTRA